MKLYVLVYNWWETYSCWTPCCSDDKALLEQKMQNWLDGEHACGNSAEAFMNEFKVEEEFITTCKKALSLKIEPHVWFKAEVEYESMGFTDDDAIQIVKLVEIIDQPIDQIPDDVFYSTFVV